MYSLNKSTLNYLQNILKKSIKISYVSFQELCIVIRHKFLIKTLIFLKLHSLSQYKVLSDLCAVDFPERKRRFEVVYNLLSIQYNTRLRLKVDLDELTALNSVTFLYPAANWMEREIWDLFGIFFTRNQDIRRILTDYGFEGHPLRKDFPLSGFVEVRYDYIQKQVVHEPVELSQAYRLFSVESQWKNVRTRFNIAV